MFPTKKYLRKRKEVLSQDEDFYLQIWNDRPHTCTECGCYLPNWNQGKVNKMYFAHILSKGAFPKFRRNKDNIILLCADHHSQLDHGDKTKMRIWDWLDGKTQELKEKYFKK